MKRSNEEVTPTEQQREAKAQRTAAAAHNSERAELLAAVQKDPWQIQDTDYAADKEFVLAVVSKKGGALAYAAANLRADRDVVLAAVKKDVSSLEYASEDLQIDREINKGLSLKHVSEKLRSDRRVVLAAVNNHGSTLEYASEELRSDRDIVLAAVSNYGCALKFASNELQCDREVVLAAVNNYGYAFQFAASEFQSDRDIIVAAVNSADTSLLWFAEFDCTTDEGIETVQAVLENIQKKYENNTPLQLWFFLPDLKETLIRLYHKLKETDQDFSICEDVGPVIFAQQWISRLRESQWCLDQACSNASVSIDTQRNIEQFILSLIHI